MNKNNLLRNLLLAVTTMVLFASPQIANAEPPVPNVSGDLEVNIVGKGTVTGYGINCPPDCAQSATWKENEVPSTNTLTASNSAAGWAFAGWSGACSVQSNQAVCKSGYGTEEPFVSTATFVDVMAPSIYLSSISPADEVGEDIYAGVVTSDNDSVTRVEYMIDGQVTNTVASSPWYAQIDTSGLAEGTHQLQARSFDPSGNSGITANWPITVDHTAPVVSLNAPITATSGSAPEFSFDSNSADYESAGCDIHPKGAEYEQNGCGRNETYSEETAAEGVWIFEVLAEDRAGNVAVKKHEFVVDRTAPGLAFTSGPADNETVAKGDVSYGWSVEDGLAVTQKCSIDGGVASPCHGMFKSTLLRGTHTFKVEATDQVGNGSSISRTVKVIADGDGPGPDGPGGPDGPNGPDGPSADKTAPVVKLATARQKLKALKRGLRVSVTCDEACSGQVTASAKGGVRFTGKVSLTSTASAKVKLRPNKKAKKASRLSTKALKLSVVSTLNDAAGNQAISTLRVKIRS